MHLKTFPAYYKGAERYTYYNRLNKKRRQPINVHKHQTGIYCSSNS